MTTTKTIRPVRNHFLHVYRNIVRHSTGVTSHGPSTRKKINQSRFVINSCSVEEYIESLESKNQRYFLQEVSEIKHIVKSDQTICMSPKSQFSLGINNLRREDSSKN